MSLWRTMKILVQCLESFMAFVDALHFHTRCRRNKGRMISAYPLACSFQAPIESESFIAELSKIPLKMQCQFVTGTCRRYCFKPKRLTYRTFLMGCSIHLVKKRTVKLWRWFIAEDSVKYPTPLSISETSSNCPLLQNYLGLWSRWCRVVQPAEVKSLLLFGGV